MVFHSVKKSLTSKSTFWLLAFFCNRDCLRYWAIRLNCRYIPSATPLRSSRYFANKPSIPLPLLLNFGFFSTGLACSVVPVSSAVEDVVSPVAASGSGSLASSATAVLFALSVSTSVSALFSVSLFWLLRASCNPSIK